MNEKHIFVTHSLLSPHEKPKQTNPKICKRHANSQNPTEHTYTHRNEHPQKQTRDL